LACLVSVVVGDTGAGGHENYCKDLPDFTKLKFVKQDVNVCHTKIEKICKQVEVTKCIKTPTIDCDVELVKTCTNTWVEKYVNKSVPVMDMKNLPWCEIKEKWVEHNKTKYECQNVTKQHCTSLWKIENGQKVWAGNDDCKDVTWEECKPVLYPTKLKVPWSFCQPENFTFLTFENQTEKVRLLVTECTVEPKAVCNTESNGEKCAYLQYEDCVEKPVTKCDPVPIPIPTKDRIHKQWCLYDKTPPPSSTPRPYRSSRDLDTSQIDSDVFTAEDTKAGAESSDVYDRFKKLLIKS